MIYFTADTHFGHGNIIKYENRPFADIEEMNTHMIKNWNEKVEPDDDIYILGDLIFGKGQNANDILNQLNGKKYLVKGNHDSFLRDKKFDRDLLVWVKDYYVLKYNNRKFVLFHYPIQVWDCRHYDSIHLYGHVHSKTINKIPNSYNVGVDVNNFTPISIEEIIEKVTVCTDGTMNE